jgi:hypothetical protein
MQNTIDISAVVLLLESRLAALNLLPNPVEPLNAGQPPSEDDENEGRFARSDGLEWSFAARRTNEDAHVMAFVWTVIVTVDERLSDTDERIDSLQLGEAVALVTAALGQAVMADAGGHVVHLGEPDGAIEAGGERGLAAVGTAVLRFPGTARRTAGSAVTDR